MSQRILTTKEVLSELKVSREKFRQLRKRPGFPIQPCTELGRGRFPADVVEEYLDLLNGKQSNSRDNGLSDRLAERLRRMHGQGENAVSGLQAL